MALNIRTLRERHRRQSRIIQRLRTKLHQQDLLNRDLREKLAAITSLITDN